MANPIKKCVLHSGQSDGAVVDLYPRTNLASVSDMTAFARTLNGAADAAAARNALEITTQAALINIIYPVGSVITLTNDTDPNKIYTGTTWVKMDAGRVLVSAGTYTEGSDTYTYALGDKGGEAKHQNTIEEMPAHDHTASVSSVGNHSHEIKRGSNTSNTDCIPDYRSTGHWLANGDGSYVGTTQSAGGFSQSIAINQSGGNVKANNMQPYQVVNRWKRTA